MLIGAGHAHLHVAKNASQFSHRNADLVLVDPGNFWYSGLATGMLGGMYEPALDQVDVQKLIERAGGGFLRDTAIELDRERRVVRLASGAVIDYALLSINAGSEVAIPEEMVAADNMWTVKPIANLWRLREQLVRGMHERGDQGLSVIVIGGGATGCEIALNIDALARKCGGRVRVTLISRSERLLKRHPAGAAHRIEVCMKRRGIDVLAATPFGRVESGFASCGDRHLAFDALVVATGLRPPAFMRDFGLKVDEEGGLCVDRYLRSHSDPRVFGAGDCIALDEHKLPRLGVFGVRQAPVLLNNLLATLDDQALREYQPQKRYLAILNLGCGDGLATWAGFYWRGRASLWWKDRIDRRFLALYA